MNKVIQAKKHEDKCALCGKPIRPGTVFVIKYAGRISTGLCAYYCCHLWCDARTRGATKERLRPRS